MINVNLDNYKKYLNKDVEVEISCYDGGVLYPSENILIGMNEFVFYFYSKSDDIFWHWDFKKVEGEMNCSVDVFVKS